MAFTETTHAGIATVRKMSPLALRVLFLAVVAGAGAVAVWSAAPDTASDVELVELLRMMAVLKAAMAAALGGAVLWRLAAPVRPARFLGYAGAGAAMSAGVALIWTATRLGLGAVLLHGGLAAGLLLLWLDPAVGAALTAAVAARRRRLR